jgi:predicted regulator of Ras-like GTPase activity (Roadblock/LC7/MglB family)
MVKKTASFCRFCKTYLVGQEQVFSAEASMQANNSKNTDMIDRLVPGEHESTGMIQSIGKFLLDQNDLEKIGSLVTSGFADSKVRVFGTEDATEVSEMLNCIGPANELFGSVVVGHDGLLIANTMPADVDAESLGVWALGVFINTKQVMKQLNHDEVYQIVALTPKGYLVIADFGGGLLLTLSNHQDTGKLIPMVTNIKSLTAAS